MLGERTVLDFKTALQSGKDFEESVSLFLTSIGFPIGLYFSANGQHNFGESAAHVEIKNDKKFSIYGNLFIETKERRTTDGLSAWRSAGIYDATLPWFYCIGDHTCIWLLSVRWLQKMHRTNKYEMKYTPTCEGFVISTQKADEIIIMKWVNWKKDSVL